eukprot:gene777-9027_t
MGQKQVKNRKSRIIKPRHTKSLCDTPEICIVLLGPGEVGKSTIFKQIQLIFDKNFIEEFDFRIVNENSLMYFRDCIQVLDKEIGSKWTDTKDQNHKESINITRNLSNLQMIVEYDALPVKEIQETISDLYNEDLPLKKILKNNHRHSIGDPVKYILSNVENYMNDDYEYTEQDLMKAYKKTTGVSKFEFMYKEQKFVVYDTGGQRNERLKWKWITEKANAVIYVGALSQYNETCYEDETTNKILECLSVLGSVLEDEKVFGLPFYLYLNKRDVLLEQLQLEDISVAFPDCPKELKFKENNLLQFTSPIQVSTKKRRDSRQDSWQETKKVGITSRITELSQDELFQIFSFLHAKEVCRKSLVSSEFYDASNIDGLWKQYCLNYDPNIKMKKIEEFYDPLSKFAPWKYFYIKSKEFFTKSENYLVEKFMDLAKHQVRDVYVTSAIDKNVRNIILETLDDLIALKKDQQNQFIIPMNFDEK